MLYIFKKVFSRFFFPLPLCLELLFFGLLMLQFTKKQKVGKRLVTLAGVLIFLFGSPYFSGLLLRPLESRYPPLAIKAGNGASLGLSEVKFIVVLGGGVSYDNTHPDRFQLTEASILRLMEGVRVSRDLNGCKLIFSGGPGRGGVISTAQAMAQLAQELGVGRQYVILEPQVRDTEEEAMQIGPIVRGQPFILVTEASHMPRAMALFRKQGTHPVADPIDFRASPDEPTMMNTVFPNAAAFYGSERAIYEYLGLALEKFRGKI
jgi:uncharacterized SAM-binding protein YcdF (DUF218 family)